MALIGVLRGRPLSALARRFFRVDAFTLFYISHLFFYAYLVLLLLHAKNFWKWMVGPGALWIADRAYLLLAQPRDAAGERGAASWARDEAGGARAGAVSLPLRRVRIY
jgi:hypothetical protein